MADDRGQRRGPLWQFVPHVAHVGKVGQLPGVAPSLPAQQSAGPADLRPIRDAGEWRPSVIMRRFGPMADERDYLPRLIVACAAIGGAHRLRELCERLGAQLGIAYPRVARMVDDEALARRKDVLQRLLDRLNVARRELPATRARANNDLDRSHPDGLRMVDLSMLVEHTGAVVLGAEIANKRNLTGLDYALRAATNVPEQRYVEDWLDRLLGTANLSGILLLTPQGYGRVVVVYDDGRLAYDPAAPPEDDEEA